MFKKFATAFLAAAMFVGTAMPAFAAEEFNLVFLANENDEEYDAAKVLKNFVESRSDMKVNIFPGAQLCGGPRDCFESLDAGVIDIYVATAGGVSVVYPPIGALDLPYSFENDEEVNAIMSGNYSDKLRKFLYDGTKGKFMLMSFSNTGGWRNYANSKHPFKSPADIKGMKLRTVENHVQMEQVRLHGGSPTPIPFMEVYTSLQTGVVDGTLNSISDLTNAKLHERAKFMTLDGHNYMFCLWMMSTNRLKSLSKEKQDLLIAGFDLMGRVQNGVQVNDELGAWETFKKSGGVVYDPTPAEKAAFKKAVEPVREWYKKQYGKEGVAFLTAMDQAIADAKAEVNARHGAIQSFLKK